MSKIKLGIQAHSVREAFAEDPIGTMKKIKAMGYTGVEIAMGSITSMNENLVDNSAEFYRKALEETGLECYGLLTSWENVQPENIEATIKFNKDMGSPFLVIGSVPPKLVSTKEEVESVVSYMKEIQKIINKEGIVTGYHNHDSDFTNVIDGKTFFEHVFDNTPDDFVMLFYCYKPFQTKAQGLASWKPRIYVRSCLVSEFLLFLDTLRCRAFC